MNFDDALQKAIDKQKAETGVVNPECVLIYDVPFSKTEYTQLRESKYMMDNFDVVADLKRGGLKIADELLPKSINGYMVRYVLELTPSEFVYPNILNVHVCVSLFCNGTGKPTTFHERHAFDLSDAKRYDGSNNESFYHHANTRYRSIFEHLLHSICRLANVRITMTDNQRAYEAAICEVAHVNDIGDVSDGFHTFNQLYHQRAMLFAALVNQNRDISWKSRKHEDGEPCFGGGWFLVTIDTPDGPYGYHYEEKYWDLFNCKELEKAKHWDGYTEEDVGRLMSLEEANEDDET